MVSFLLIDGIYRGYNPLMLTTVEPDHFQRDIQVEVLHSGNFTNIALAGKWGSRIEDVWHPMGIIQCLVYQRVKMKASEFGIVRKRE